MCCVDHETNTQGLLFQPSVHERKNSSQSIYSYLIWVGTFMVSMNHMQIHLGMTFLLILGRAKWKHEKLWDVKDECTSTIIKLNHPIKLYNAHTWTMGLEEGQVRHWYFSLVFSRDCFTFQTKVHFHKHLGCVTQFLKWNKDLFQIKDQTWDCYLKINRL